MSYKLANRGGGMMRQALGRCSYQRDMGTFDDFSGGQSRC
jgi:hypothetical protein